MADDRVRAGLPSKPSSRYSQLVRALSGPRPAARAEVPVILAFFREKLESEYMRNLLESEQVHRDGE